MADKIPSKWGAIMACKCPRCRNGNMFPFPVYNVRRMLDMNEHCPHCHLKFEIEPGYYYGAMYISYAMTCAIGIILGVILWKGFGDPDVNVYLCVILSSIFIFSPVTFRYSRVITSHIISPIRFEKRYFEGKPNAAGSVGQ